MYLLSDPDLIGRRQHRRARRHSRRADRRLCAGRRVTRHPDVSRRTDFQHVAHQHLVQFHVLIDVDVIRVLFQQILALLAKIDIDDLQIRVFGRDSPRQPQRPL